MFLKHSPWSYKESGDSIEFPSSLLLFKERFAQNLRQSFLCIWKNAVWGIKVANREGIVTHPYRNIVIEKTMVNSKTESRICEVN